MCNNCCSPADEEEPEENDVKPEQEPEPAD